MNKSRVRFPGFVARAVTHFRVKNDVRKELLLAENRDLRDAYRYHRHLEAGHMKDLLELVSNGTVSLRKPIVPILISASRDARQSRRAIEQAVLVRRQRRLVGL